MPTQSTEEDAARELRRLLSGLDLDVAAREFGRVIGVKVVARLVGVSERYVVKAVLTGQLRATRVGKDYVVRISDLRRYVQRRRPRGRPRRGPGRPRIR